MLQLSQSALAAFHRCPRRFYLRFVRRLEWPAPLTGSEQDWERSLRRGELLHLLIQQASLGIPVDDLVAAIEDDVLASWWTAVVEHPPPQPPGVEYAEIELAVPFGEHRLVARFDRLIVAAQETAALHIVDWKTGRPQEPERLQRSWQTAVYRYVAVEAGAHVTGGRSVEPSAVGFTYWQAERAEAPVLLTYDDDEHTETSMRLARAVEQIDTCLADGEEGFQRTQDVDACRHCPYRSYCERGRQAPSGLDIDEDLLDLEPLTADDGDGL